MIYMINRLPQILILTQLTCSYAIACLTLLGNVSKRKVLLFYENDRWMSWLEDNGIIDRTVMKTMVQSMELSWGQWNKLTCQ